MQSLNTRNQEKVQNPVEINQHDKFFTRIMSKDTSVLDSSCRVYYGGSSGSVPFMWESRPGTPKHTLFSDACDVPPLTPPPSYFSSSKSMHKNMKPNHTLLSNIFPRFTNPRKKNHVTPFSSMSSTSTTTSSSIYSSSSSSSSSLSSFYSPWVNSKAQRRQFLPCSTPLNFSFDEDCDNNDDENTDDKKNHRCRTSPDSTMCFDFVKSKAVRGRYMMNNMKNKFLSKVGNNSS